MANETKRWACGACTNEWDSELDPPEKCPACEARQVLRVAPPVIGGVVQEALREVDLRYAEHARSLNAVLDAREKEWRKLNEALTATLDGARRDLFRGLAMAGMLAGSRETSVEHIVGKADEVAERMLAQSARPASEVSSEETRDTERPPAFTPEEPGTLEPVVVPTGRMVGAERDGSERVTFGARVLDGGGIESERFNQAVRDFYDRHEGKQIHVTYEVADVEPARGDTP